ncbi:MAG: glycosyltransferase family 2 protein [Chloroflexi bacterium]|nr:glycosyltransferase family 2 protein [Chloroflexota bacterium]
MGYSMTLRDARRATFLEARADDRLRQLGLVSVVVPAFNEETAIGHDLDTILATLDAVGVEYEVIVVDDGSTDRTAEEVRCRPRVRLVRHPVNLGVGAARKTGMRMARGNIIITTDGDGTYPNHEMPRLLAELADYDMVVGARRQEAGTLRWLRAPAKTAIRWLASSLAGTRIPDLNSGLRCFRKDTAERFLPLLPQGHSWESTITLAFLTNGYTVKYVPVDYYPRRGGSSSFHPLRDTFNTLRLVFRIVFYFYPLRVLGPVAFLLVLLGGMKLVRDGISDHFHVSGSTVMIILTGIHLAVLGVIADLIIKRSGRL